jgi:zinc transporter ZupT
MIAIILSLATFFSTLLGGVTALKNQKWLDKILSYTAGVLIGLVAFDLLPEIAKINRNLTWAMAALVTGFLAFHILESAFLTHPADDQYSDHKHPHVGLASALALSGHSFLDGVGIGLGFQLSNTVGIAVAIAVIAHDFSDGLNTVSLMLQSHNSSRRSKQLLFLDAAAPVLGAASTLLFTLSERYLVIYLGFFAGFLLYIAASNLLPLAHTKDHSRLTTGLTVLGVIFMFIVTRFA